MPVLGVRDQIFPRTKWILGVAGKHLPAEPFYQTTNIMF